MTDIRKKVIDDLGEWLCRDMEKSLVQAHEGIMSTDRAEKVALIRDVAERIQWYRDNLEKGEDFVPRQNEKMFDIIAEEIVENLRK